MITLYLTDISDIDIKDKKLYNKISADRRERIRNTVSENKKKQLLGAGLLLRHALISNGLSPDTEIKYGENGKPYAEGIKFSLSHSDKYVLIATSYSEIGADIEKIDASQNLFVAQRLFAGEDIKDIDISRFFSMFTRLESYGKMTGKGLFPVLKTPMILIKNAYTYEYSGYMLSVCTEKKEDIIYPPALLKF